MSIYTARMNESLIDISKECGVSPAILSKLNDLPAAHRLTEGRELLVLNPTRTYNAKRLDTLDSISGRFGIPRSDLIHANPDLRGGEPYEGQVLALRYDSPSLGMAAANGYCFGGTSRESLERCLPYLTVLTVCAARADGRGISMLFDDSWVLELAAAYGVPSVLRIYTDGSLPEPENDEGFIQSAAILAKSHGYSGVALSEISSAERNRLLGFMLKMKSRLMEFDLTLTAEADGENFSGVDFADNCVISFDRLKERERTKFKDGEEAALRAFAEEGAAERTFIDISTFALLGEKYIPLSDAYRIADRRGLQISFDKDTLLCSAEAGSRCRPQRLLFESLKSIKAKLDLIWELGFMGISFDIMRIPTPHLMLYNSSFTSARDTLTESPLNCKGDMRSYGPI